MQEVEVVRKTRGFLLGTRNFMEHGVSQVFTDAHPTLTQIQGLSPFQRFTVDLGAIVVHPDLVGQLRDGETVFAVEAKGETDLFKGLMQAELYQNGFHYSWLAASAGGITDTIVRKADQRNIGLLSVSDDVKVLHQPRAILPTRDNLDVILRQFSALSQVSSAQTYHYNLPTHYLVWTIVMEPEVWYPIEQLEVLVQGYRLPKGTSQALSGAIKLGVVSKDGSRFQLTLAGKAVQEILASTLQDWNALHVHLTDPKCKVHLVDVHPKTAAALRLLLFNDPLVTLMVKGLKRCEGHQATFDHLAQECFQVDPVKASVFFFTPEALPEITDDRGTLIWERVKPHHYRSRTFHQFKSILMHAGVLRKARLGGSSSKVARPEKDMWALRS